MGHTYMVAAFCLTWAVHLGYVLWMVAKWLGQRDKFKAEITSRR